MATYDTLIALLHGQVAELTTGAARLAVCPTLGGRVFVEVGGIFAHRLDLENVAQPDRPFNNYGGGNFWPAPEGGAFGFNYQGDAWYVQPAINREPFTLISAGQDLAVLSKQTQLLNRAGTVLEVAMGREVRLTPAPSWMPRQERTGLISYTTRDTITVRNTVTTGQALLAAWTLDQFAATENTVAFCVVENPESAINFDFYEHPGDRITYYPHGFTYRTDGQCRGQLGIRLAAHARCIGCYDLAHGLLCLRENRNAGTGSYFNIADNEQPAGPYSAADAYSIFNSDPEMAAFELETIGGALIEDTRLRGTELLSATTLASYAQPAMLEEIVREMLQ